MARTIRRRASAATDASSRRRASSMGGAAAMCRSPPATRFLRLCCADQRHGAPAKQVRMKLEWARTHARAHPTCLALRPAGDALALWLKYTSKGEGERMAEMGFVVG